MTENQNIKAASLKDSGEEVVGDLAKAMKDSQVAEKTLGVRELRKQLKRYSKRLAYNRYHKVPTIQV